MAFDRVGLEIGMRILCKMIKKREEYLKNIRSKFKSRILVSKLNKGNTNL